MPMESPQIPPKPRSEVYRPDLVRLPPLTPWRRLWRRFLQALVRLVVRLALRFEVHGEANLPRGGPMLVVSNHLGDADLVVGLAASRFPFDAIAKVELYDLPLVGWLLHSYG
ncbi:MAG: 1-acyl-sn-glycerol-3-phosphate acyltransferase, partial [Anaerolineae bacterium]